MVCLATATAAHLCRRVRCRSANTPAISRIAKPLRILAAERADTVCDWTAEWWPALAPRFQPARKAKGVDLGSPGSVPLYAFRPLHLSSRISDHSRFIPNML